MDNAKTMVIFEHPLNEKMRIWLRLEFLIKQLLHNKNFEANNALFFFHLLDELLEIIERNDIRSDLLKNIEEQKQKLSIWLDVPGVDKPLLDDLLIKLNTFIHELNFNPKLGQDLKEDRFISSIRKRITIPGGCCSFDLPFFHLWLQQPQTIREEQIDQWLQSLSTLFQTISLCMQLIRQSSHFEQLSCTNHFYQNSQDDISLLRIKVPLDKKLYPQVSGNNNRYAIRFLPLEPIMNNNDQEMLVEFELACC
ncbi:cell division protein ZapD [Frischella sp. Ac48]|uniref:Cell division protein ZapD n=1 Tax=Frischella japonica TaxID=2741544 RepID=A0ABR7QVW0_9GAMM|nr:MULTISPECIES: cell division protein ZapD [Frischella]MBC9130113.1 cell division protein ZapD [Frischella japonica]MBX4133097.1 cell division protein ZapD [Frischella sp. Ac48]